MDKIRIPIFKILLTINYHLMKIREITQLIKMNINRIRMTLSQMQSFRIKMIIICTIISWMMKKTENHKDYNKILSKIVLIIKVSQLVKVKRLI